jgi:nitrate/TMAO reductase-like tetraheme cytochrome c subunit
MSASRKTLKETTQLNQNYIAMLWANHSRECEHCHNNLIIFMDKALKTTDADKEHFIDQVKDLNFFELGETLKELEKRDKLDAFSDS